MEISEETWQFFQKHLGYNDEEMALFRANPRNTDILTTGPDLMTKTIVCEGVEAHGCNSQHKAGDRFVFDGAGNLLTAKNPERICMGALLRRGRQVRRLGARRDGSASGVAPSSRPS